LMKNSPMLASLLPKEVAEESQAAALRRMAGCGIATEEGADLAGADEEDHQHDDPPEPAAVRRLSQ
jgi:hypothetical protein